MKSEGKGCSGLETDKSELAMKERELLPIVLLFPRCCDRRNVIRRDCLFCETKTINELSLLLLDVIGFSSPALQIILIDSAKEVVKERESESEIKRKRKREVFVTCV